MAKESPLIFHFHFTDGWCMVWTVSWADSLPLRATELLRPPPQTPKSKKKKKKKWERKEDSVEDDEEYKDK